MLFGEAARKWLSAVDAMVQQHVQKNLALLALAFLLNAMIIRLTMTKLLGERFRFVRELVGPAVVFLVSVAVVDVVARRIPEWNLRAARLRASWQRNPIHLRVLDIFVVSSVASGIGTSHPVPIELRLVLFLSLFLFLIVALEGPDYPMELWTEMKKLDQSEILRLVSFGFLVHTIVRLEVIFASKHNMFPWLSSILVNFGLLRLLGLFCHYVVGNREMFVPWWRRQEGVQWPHVAMASEAASAVGCLLCAEVLCNTTVCLALLPNFALIVLAETADYLMPDLPERAADYLIAALMLGPHAFL